MGLSAPQGGRRGHILNFDSRYIVVATACFLIGIFVSPYAQFIFGINQSSPRLSAGLAEAQFCRMDWSAHVWSPARFRLIDPCAKVSGTIIEGPPSDEHDGDVKIFVSLDSQFASIVNDVNRNELNGSLVVEIIAVDVPGVDIPDEGVHATLYGALVVDLAEGWVELHPTWTIQILDVDSTLKDNSNSTAVVDATITRMTNQTTTQLSGAFVFFELADPSGRATQWIFSRTDRTGLAEATFGSLKPGDYTLRVYARQLGHSGFSEFTFTAA